MHCVMSEAACLVMFVQLKGIEPLPKEQEGMGSGHQIHDYSRTNNDMPWFCQFPQCPFLGTGSLHMIQPYHSRKPRKALSAENWGIRNKYIF